MTRMKLFSNLIISLFMIVLTAQNSLTSKEWQEDLRFLQKNVHSDYKNLFHKITKEEFDKAVDNFYDHIPTMQDHEVKVGFAEIVALFGYGHTNLTLIAWRYDPIENLHQLPLNFYWFSDGIYIEGAHKDYKQALGAKVVKIGETPIDDVLEAIKPVVSAENDQFFKGYNGMYYLGVPEILHAKGVIEDISNVSITLEKENKQYVMNFKPIVSNGFPGKYGLVQTKGDWLSARAQDTTPLWLKNFDKKYYFEYLEDSKSVYVRQSSVFHDKERIDDFYSRVFNFIDTNDVERLIIDLRLNGGGDNFNNKPVILGLIKNEKINQKGKLFVILGRRTFSAAQNLVNEIDNYTEVIFVGEPTAQNINFYGDSREVILPNSKLSIRLSWAWWQDKPQWLNADWTAPHYAVDLSFQDYITNHDPVLNAIFLGSDLELKISELAMNGNMEGFKTQINKYIQNPKYQFYNFRTKINKIGYRFISLEQNQEALAIFKVNTELFPDSPNSWDSLAEGYWRNGDISEAKKLYNKVIQMDPMGRTGENARNMLKRMGKQ